MEVKGNYELKQKYNYNLERYENGCKYIKEHKEETDKWLPEIGKILDNMNNLINEIEKTERTTSEDRLNGFKI